MGVFGRTLTALFLSSGGLFVLAALESTVFFWFPFGVDAAVILLVARNEDRAWLYPVIATAGSVLGTALTLWMGKKVGEAGISRYVPERRLKAVKAKVKKKGAVAIALLGIIPPPFPFTVRACVWCAQDKHSAVSRGAHDCQACTVWRGSGAGSQIRPSGDSMAQLRRDAVRRRRPGRAGRGRDSRDDLQRVSPRSACGGLTYRARYERVY